MAAAQRRQLPCAHRAARRMRRRTAPRRPSPAAMQLILSPAGTAAATAWPAWREGGAQAAVPLAAGRAEAGCASVGKKKVDWLSQGLPQTWAEHGRRSGKRMCMGDEQRGDASMPHPRLTPAGRSRPL